MDKQVGKKNLFETVLPNTLGKSSRLEKLLEIIDWSELQEILKILHTSKSGRPAYPTELMFKSLLLAQWYDLSDPRLEEALNDSLSFRRFVGLSLCDETPDHATICRFRQLLERFNLSEKLFTAINSQLEAKGLIIKKGTLLDATIVAAQAAKPPYSSTPSPRQCPDNDANWTKKGGRYHFGYKAHIGVDQTSGIIRTALLTPAKVYESEVAEALICGDERAVYADKAYEHKERRKRLKAEGIKDRIMHRSHKNQAGLPFWQKRRNKLISPIRSAVERVFGTLKRIYGYTKVRYYSLQANQNQLFLLAMAFNLNKAVKLAS